MPHPSANTPPPAAIPSHGGVMVFHDAAKPLPGADEFHEEEYECVFRCKHDGGVERPAGDEALW